MPMNSSLQAGLIVLLFLLLTGILAIRNRNREVKQQFLKQAKERWGSQTPQEMTIEAYQSIRLYSDQYPVSSDHHIIDDITWNDCDLDQLYRRMNQTLSSPGSDVLYAWMRHPLLNQSSLRMRSELIDYVETHEEDRQALMACLFQIGRHPKKSYFASMQKLTQARRIGSRRYLLFGGLTLLLIILLFFHPVLAVILMIPDFIINLSLQMSRQRMIREYISAIAAAKSLLDGAKQISELRLPTLSDTNEKLQAICQRLAPFRRSSGFITAKGTVGSSLSDAVLEYLNLFFHLDLIQFDHILAACEGHEDDFTELTELIGTLDAAISAASFRASLPYWCRLSDTAESNGQPSLHTDALYHPLLDHAVPNTLRTSGGNLITGANASGKSTFLKSLAIGMILGQSIDTIPARVWEAPFCRIYTSMALNDNLSSGESYFMVEIRSLKRILDAANEDAPPVFAVIDEVLRGTNTIERIAASAQLLSACAARPALIFAATHDIELTRLLKHRFSNYHFSGTIQGRDVQFDYTLKNGPTTERNAIHLLKTAGYDEQLADLAEAAAKHFEATGEWKL